MDSAKHRVALVLGTRPEFIKFFSVIRALEHQCVPFFIVHTGQHYSVNLDSVFFQELGLPKPAYHLHIANLTPSEQIGRMTQKLRDIFSAESPSMVLVQGDTNTVIAGTLAASKLGVPVGNIEAGLRSHNFSMAEEKNRILANQLATFLFAPTKEALDNLLKEGFDEHKIYNTGNTVADAIEHFAPISEERSDVLNRFALKPKHYFLVTMHRAELTDVREHFADAVAALNEVARSHTEPVVFPVHPRTRKYIDQYGWQLDERIWCIEPLGYLDFLRLLKSARLVITDSGGIQEEACILHVPTVTVREETERPETVRVGSNLVSGYAKQSIVSAVETMLTAPLAYEHPYGSSCGEQIVEIVKGNISSIERQRILVISDTYLPLVGGAELYTYHFAQHLLNFGYAVTVVTNTEGETPHGPSNLTILRTPWPGWRHPVAIAKLARDLYRLTRASDLVFANYTYRMSSVEALVALAARRPLFIFAHGLGTIIDAGFPRVYYAYRYLSLKLSRGVIATSTEIADITKRFTQNVTVATAVDFSTIDRSVDSSDVRAIRERFPGRKIIVTVRRLVPKNGIQFLIMALASLRQLRTDFVYLALGGGRLEPHLRELVQRLDLGAHVVFEGEIANARVFSYVSGADAVIFPSSAEAMSLACIEAMYLGKPVVTTAVGGLIELVGADESRGQLVDLFGRSESVYTAPDHEAIPKERYDEFARKIDAALADGRAIEEKVARAKKYVEREFNWSVVTNKIMSFVRASL